MSAINVIREIIARSKTVADSKEPQSVVEMLLVFEEMEKALEMDSQDTWVKFSDRKPSVGQIVITASWFKPDNQSNEQYAYDFQTYIGRDAGGTEEMWASPSYGYGPCDVDYWCAIPGGLPEKTA